MSYKEVQKKDEQMFIRNIIFLREEKKWSQSEMVKKIGHDLKFKTYQAWEERRAFPPVFFCRLIAQIFQKNMHILLTENLANKLSAG